MLIKWAFVGFVDNVDNVDINIEKQFYFDKIAVFLQKNIHKIYCYLRE